VTVNSSYVCFHFVDHRSIAVVDSQREAGWFRGAWVQESNLPCS